MVSNHKKKKKGAGYGAKRHGQNPHRRNQGAFHSFRDFDDDDDDDDDDIFGFSIKGAAAKDASRRPWSRKGGKDTQKSSFGMYCTSARTVEFLFALLFAHTSFFLFSF